MKISEKEFKDSIIDNKKRPYLELIISDILDIAFDDIHNQLVIDPVEIIKDASIPINKRPYVTIVTFNKYIVLLFKNNSFEEKNSCIVEEIMHKISKKFPDKNVAGINFNDFEE